MNFDPKNRDIIVDKYLPKACFYQLIFMVADAKGIDASAAVKTQAISLSDGSIMPDGIGGHAWVVLPDGRKGFARWILKIGFAR